MNFISDRALPYVTWFGVETSTREGEQKLKFHDQWTSEGWEISQHSPGGYKQLNNVEIELDVHVILVHERWR